MKEIILCDDCDNPAEFFIQRDRSTTDSVYCRDHVSDYVDEDNAEPLYLNDCP